MADISKITIEDGTYDIKDVTARSNITSLTNRVNNLDRPRKYVFIGDSYDAQVDPSNPTSIKWWSTVIAEVLGLSASDYIRSSNGGAAFARNDNSFYALINALNYDEDVTDILIAGGYNDQYYSYSDISNSGWSCDTLINNKFPNARKHLAFIDRKSVV